MKRKFTAFLVILAVILIDVLSATRREKIALRRVYK